MQVTDYQHTHTHTYTGRSGLLWARTFLRFRHAPPSTSSQGGGSTGRGFDSSWEAGDGRRGSQKSWPKPGKHVPHTTTCHSRGDSKNNNQLSAPYNLTLGVDRVQYLFFPPPPPNYPISSILAFFSSPPIQPQAHLSLGIPLQLLKCFQLPSFSLL